jgi:hypothetical protein
MIVSIVALAAVTATLDPADCRSSLPEGPGLTLDESFNVQMGVYLARCVSDYGVGLLHPDSAAEVFGVAGYNPDHPPLGRLWLGIAHQLVESLFPAKLSSYAGAASVRFAIVSARVGSAAAFALTVLLIGVFTGRRWGQLAGTAAALCFALMPRVFGHAHFAALETVMNLFWTLALLTTASLWNGSQSTDGPANKGAALSGLLIGLALLTKIQAVLLPPLVVLWAVVFWRIQALRPLAVCGVTAAVTFFVGWPWLWLDLPGNVVDYFARTTDRTVLHVWYQGERFVDRDVPWHYPWVNFVATTPIGILVVGTMGCIDVRKAESRRSLLLIGGSVLAPLVLFSLPGIAVYDGVRLFLVAFPGWAVLAGIGTQKLHAWLSRRVKQPTLWTAAFLASNVVGIVWLHPFQLSYYSAAVGGTAGAARLGLEANYWGDAISRSLLEEIAEELPPGALVEFAPLMHPYQLKELYQLPVVERARVRLKPYNVAPRGPWLLVFHRLADAPSEEQLRSEGWAIVTDVQRQRVRLASLWQKQR